MKSDFFSDEACDGTRAVAENHLQEGSLQIKLWILWISVVLL